MGFFDSVASTVFNTATSAYNTVVRPVTTAASSVVRTVSQPIVQGSYSTGATEQVSVQPKPPIVTAVSNRPVTPSPGTTVTPQTTPSGKQVYVTSRASPVQPDPVIVTRPVQIQAPSAAQLIGSLAPGGALVGAAQLISGDQNVLRNVVMDLPGTGTFTGTPTLAGYRETAIKQQQIAAQTRIQQQEQAIAGFKQEVAQRKILQEQAILGFEARRSQLESDVSAFNRLGPATSIEEYNTRLSTANLLNTRIAGLEAEGSQINADILASTRDLYKQQIGLLNENDAINRDLVNLNVASANLGTTGIGGLALGWEEKINKPISNVLLTEFGKPFGATKEDVALGLRLNRIASESMVTYGGPSIQNLGMAYGSGMLEDTLIKPGDALLWTGIGVATGGVTRALAPGMEAAVAASRVQGASLGARALGAGIRGAPYVMGAAFAGQVGFEAGFESTPTGLKMRSPGAMLSRLGGLTATEVAPMVGGGIVGYKLPEIYGGARQAVGSGVSGLKSKVKTGELGQIGRQIREIPFTSTEPMDVGIAPSGRGKTTLLTQKQLARARSIASTGDEQVIAFDVTTGKEIKLTKVKSTSNKVQWEYPEGIDPTHEVISLHSHPKEITFSRGDMRKFGFDTKVNEIAKGVVTPSGKVHIIEKPLKGNYNADVFVQRWMEEYKPNWLRDIFQPKGRRIKTFAKTAAEMEMPFRIIEPEQNVVLRATRIGPQRTAKIKSSIELEPRVFDIESRLKIDWETGSFEPFTSRIGTGKPTTIKPGGTAKLSEAQRLGIQERVYSGKPLGYTPKQRGRFPGTREFIDERGFWSHEKFPSEKFLDIQAKTIKRGTPKGVGGITQTPKPVMEELGIGKGWKVTEKAATDALAKWNQPELGPPNTVMGSKFNKPFKAVGRKMNVGTSAKTAERIKLSRDISQVYQQGYRVAGETPTGFEFEPLFTEGTGKSILPIGKKFSKPAPSPGGSKSLSKTFKNAEDLLNPISSKKGAKGGSQELKLISKSEGLEQKPLKTESISYDVPIQEVTGVKGVYLGRSELPNAAGLVRGRRGVRLYDIEESSLVGPLSLGGLGIAPLSREKEDTALAVGVMPMIANVGIVGNKAISGSEISQIMRDNSRFETTLKNIQPAITQFTGIGQLPDTLVGTIIEPSLKVTPIITPDIGLKIDQVQLQPQIITNIQAPDLGLKQFQQQINITDLEIPPYTPPEYTFEIPPIPPPIIPGFPMGLGGGGGGGGYGGDRGGYLFEETLQGGGDSDPFGIGRMNFDVGSLSGAWMSSGRGKRRRRKK